MQRRDFLRTGAMTALASQRVLGANDRIGVALIGCGGRGRGVTAYVPEIGGAEVRGVSDVYVPRREQAAEQFGSTAKAFKDYRDVLVNSLEQGNKEWGTITARIESPTDPQWPPLS